MKSMQLTLDGRRALVTGGSLGLGFLLARELAREGCRLAICARDAAELERARAELEREGAEVFAHPCDISRDDDVQALVDAVTRRFGRVDLLVANAGIIQVGPLETMSLQDFHDAMDVMYWGVVYPTVAVLPQMRERRHGRIVCITSIGGKVAVPHLLPYTSAKFAAVGFSEGLRAELAGAGISVTTIVPGLMRTGSHLNAEFKGRQGAEFTWFSLGASLPVASMDAERAARQIVRAAKRGESERVLSVSATLLAKVNGLLPGFTADLMGMVNRVVLPKPEGGAQTRARGMTVEERERSWLRDALTGLGRTSARRFHQYPGPAPTAFTGSAAGRSREQPMSMTTGDAEQTGRDAQAAGAHPHPHPGDQAPPGSESAGENLCPDCGGDGRREGRVCETCGGTGRVLETIGGE